MFFFFGCEYKIIEIYDPQCLKTFKFFLVVTIQILNLIDSIIRISHELSPLLVFDRVKR